MFKEYTVNEKVIISDFTINGMKFSEKFAGVVAKNNGDGTYLIRVKIQGRLANVMVSADSISPDK